MEWIVFIGFGIIAVIIGTLVYNKYKPSLPSSNRIPLRSTSAPFQDRSPSQTRVDQIVWTEIDISPEVNQNGWRDINIPLEASQIEWVDIEITIPPIDRDDPLIDDNFLDTSVPDDLDNILRSIIGTRDLCTQEIFNPGERVYLCRRHKLAYHEDSWGELGCQCSVCGNDLHTGSYDLPATSH
ncbi:hypothetical protein [Microcoleus sp.]|uniref:hypothetical protein n=1 Tax=Microcoleus sp. TaxID=44472 RepID=UPI0035242DBA